MRFGFLLSALALASVGSAQLRVVSYNLSNYSGGRAADLETVIFGTYQGLSLNADVLLMQEFTSQTAVNQFLNVLNSSSESSGTWAAAPFVNGPDTDNAFFYRSDRLQLVASSVISQGGNNPLPPRNTNRYDVRLKGYATLQPKIAIYGCHLKAGTGSTDQQRRLVEATNIRNNAQQLDSSFSGFVVGGDFNLQNSNDPSWIKFVGSESNNLGRLFDPINSPGNWNDNYTFRFIHTQDPSTTTMDSRYDFILLSAGLIDNVGFTYKGISSIPYSTTTWNDPNHSYRVWGNDGTSFETQLSVADNTMVGPQIAQALINAATSAGGHLPVLLDLLVPAEMSVPQSTLNFGTVIQGNQASLPIQVSNATNATLWRSGVSDLFYQMNADSVFSAPIGPFLESAGGGSNTHTISVNTSNPGTFNGTLDVSSLNSESNSVQIPLSVNVIGNTYFPLSAVVKAGALVSGNLASFATSDDNRWVFNTISDGARSFSSIDTELTTTLPISTVSGLDIEFEASSSVPQAYQNVYIQNQQTMQWTQAYSQANATLADQTIRFSVPNPNEYINVSTREVRVRIGFTPPSVGARTIQGSIDKFAFIIR